MVSLALHKVSGDVSHALSEDVGCGIDLTTSLFTDARFVVAHLLTRETAVLCGRPWFDECFRQVDPSLSVEWIVQEGDSIRAGDSLALISGSVAAILAAERTALNFLQLLSGVATRTAMFVEKVQGLSVAIVDSRKTMPGLRYAQKYAVRVGGGINHRFGLYDAVLIKDNHIAVIGSPGRAWLLSAQTYPTHVIQQIEIETLRQLEEVLGVGASRILLDNMTVDEIKAAVKMTAGRAELEVSGGVTLDNVRAYGETGVNRISIGGLTKTVQAVDFSIEIDSSSSI